MPRFIDYNYEQTDMLPVSCASLFVCQVQSKRRKGTFCLTPNPLL